MKAIAFARSTGPDDVTLFVSEDVEEVFKAARMVMPVRTLFNERLLSGLMTPEKYFRRVTTDEHLEPGVELEVLLGDAEAIKALLYDRQVNYLKEKNEKLLQSAKEARSLLAKVASGEVTPERLKRVMEPATVLAHNPEAAR